METKLRENDHRFGWRSMRLKDLVRRIANERNELKREIDNGENLQEIIREAADVANFAMMIADICREQIAKGRGIIGPDEKIRRHEQAGAYMLERLNDPIVTARVQRILQGEDQRDSSCPKCGRRGLFPGLDSIYEVSDEQTCIECGAKVMIDFDGSEENGTLKRIVSVCE
jgi:NTP pyrophosphatase (non-canonical NTP hydrolase)